MLLHGCYISSLAIESIVIIQILLLATFPLGIQKKSDIEKGSFFSDGLHAKDDEKTLSSYN